MTEFEIKTILMELGTAIDAQFNFWMATTFAIVIAHYIAGHNFSRASRFGIVALYLLACAVFYSRYLQITGLVSMNMGLLMELGVNMGPSRTGFFTLIVRQILILAGTVFAVSLIIWPRLFIKDQPPESTE